MALRSLRIESALQAESALRNIGVDPVGMASMAPKMRHLNIRIPDVKSGAANIIKQDMLSLGGDAAVARGTVSCTIPRTDVILMGTEKQLRRAVEKFKMQPLGVKEVANRLEKLLDNISCAGFSMKCRKGTLDLGGRTHIMGVLNVTPDSFSDGGEFIDPNACADRAQQMVEEGADIIDVGGESTRPGAKPVPLEEEIKRVIPVIEKIAGRIKTPLSVDTYKAEVARRSLDAGADIINDISGLRFDKEMARVAAGADCPVVLMHIKGAPKDMQANPAYDSLMDEVIDCLEEGVNIALEAGVAADKIIIDPGIGFGKRFEDNLDIINNLEELKVLGRPLLVGLSRKAFIGHLLGESDPAMRLEGTLAASALAIAKGAHIIRVHDVKEAHRATTVADAILKSS